MKIVKNIAIVIVVTCGVYLGIIAAMLHIDYEQNYEIKPLLYTATGHVQPPGGQAWHMLHEFKGADNYDLIVIGSSHAYRGYDPRIFDAAGYHMYNLGSSNQSIMNTYVLVDNLIPEGWKGKLILDIYEETFQNESIESTANLIANSPSSAMAKQIAFTHFDVRVLNMLSARMMTKAESTYEDYGYITKGYCNRTDTVSSDFIFPKEKEFKASDKALKYFRKLIHLLNKRGIEYVLVNCPSPKVNKQAHDAFIHEAITETFRKHKVKPAFYDFAVDNSLLSNRHFYDETHMNQAGVNLFNALLIEKLR